MWVARPHVALTHCAAGGFNDFAVAFPQLVEIEEAVPMPHSLAPLKTLHMPRDSPAKVKITNLEPTQILPGLYIGARKDALNRDTLAALGIRSIVNVTKDVPNAFPGDIDYVQIPVDVWPRRVALRAHPRTGPLESGPQQLLR